MLRDGGETDPDSDVNVKRLVVDSANLNVKFRLDGSMDGRLFRLFSEMTVIVSVADQCEKMVALMTV